MAKKGEDSMELLIRELEEKALKYGVINKPLTEGDQIKLRSKIEDAELLCYTSKTMNQSTILLASKKSEGKISKKMHERIIENFMDIIILAELRHGPLSGYDMISFIHNKFHLLVSSGAVYSILYSLERNGLIKGTWNERKRVYRLTDKGIKTIDTVLAANDKIKNFIISLSKAQSIKRGVRP